MGGVYGPVPNWEGVRMLPGSGTTPPPVLLVGIAEQTCEFTGAKQTVHNTGTVHTTVKLACSGCAPPPKPPKLAIQSGRVKASR